MRLPHPSVGAGWLGLLIVACGGDGSDEPGDPDQPEVEEPRHPLGAELVSQSELDELGRRGTLEPVDELSQEMELTRVEALRTDAEMAIDAFVQSNPRVSAGLIGPVTSPRATPTDDGQNLLVDVGSQTVLLQGPGLEARSVAKVLELQRDPGAQRNVMDALVAVAPEACASYAPADPTQRTAEQLAAASAEIAECTFDWWSLVGLLGDEAPTEYSQSVVVLPECDDDYDVGTGNDGASSCGTSAPLAQWPFNGALPPVRSQGRRGSCVAFATASALEYTTARFTGEMIDVSEQDAYAKGKFLLFQEHFTEGLPTQDYLFGLAGLGLPVALEEDWGYNPSWCRGIDVGALKWAESCRGYEGVACSDTAHQLGFVATSVDDAYWFLPEVGASFVTVEATQSLPTWGFGEMWNTQLTALVLLRAGYGMVASLEIDEDFVDIGPSGRLSFANDDKVGSHAVHVVRWDFDDVTGEGIVTIKNSWGCDWGDGGYAYLPASWFFDHLQDLTALGSDLVGDYEPPFIGITSPNDNATIELSSLGADVELRAQVSDAGDGYACCDVVWWSDTLEELGRGTSLDLVLNEAGEHRIFAIATDSRGNLAQDEITIRLTNTGPTARILRPAEPARRGSGAGRVGIRVPLGAAVPLASQADDPNQPSVPCASRRWYLDDALAHVGCDDVVTFDTPGWTQIRLTAQDDQRAEGNDHVWVRAVEWTEADGVYVRILNPTTPGTLLDADQTFTFEAEVFTAHPDGAELQWFANHDGNDIALGTGTQVTWRPSDDLFGPATVGFRVEATDANGTFVDFLGGFEVQSLTVP